MGTLDANTEVPFFVFKIRVVRFVHLDLIGIEQQKKKKAKVLPMHNGLFPTQRVNFYNVRFSFIWELWIHIRSS